MSAREPVELPEDQQEALLALLLAEEGFDPSRLVASIPPRQERRQAPLSFSQQRLWFLDRLEPGNPFYNVPGAVRLRGTLDPGALAGALLEIARRHEVLRTTFHEVAGEAWQRIAETAVLPLPVVDLGALPPDRREPEARRLAAAIARQPFDLERAPLLRVRLLRLADDDHALCLVMHHIVSDGWSMGILLAELSELYAALREGRRPTLAPLPVQYADYACWQRERLEGRALDRQRPNLQTYRGAACGFRLPPALSQSLTGLLRARGCTLFMGLLAGFQVLLGRYTGQEDLSVGTPVANRTRPEVAGLIGFFANTLVLRTDLRGRPGFGEVLARVREGMIGAQENQDLPFEKLVEELKPERSLSHSPLFQVLFSLQLSPGAELRLPGLAIAPLAITDETARFDLSLWMYDSGGQITGSLEYNCDLFERATIWRMIGHFERLLAAAVAVPDRPFRELSLLSATERQQILMEWGQGPGGGGDHLEQLLAVWPRRAPERVALVCAEEELTYGELDRRVNGLAHLLRELGVGPERLVGIALDRSVEMIVALLAVLKAGGAFLPLDLANPAERLSQMAESAGIHLLLTHEPALDRLPPATREVLLLERCGLPPGVSERADAPASGAVAESLAYVLYTSGSTGSPKGVAVSRGALANVLTSIARDLGFDSSDILLAVTSLGFDISLAELCLPLLCGARVVVASREDAADGARLLSLLATSRANALQATPATWRLLLEAGWQGGEGLRMVCTGEALAPALAWSLLERGRALWNLYGPTETAIWATGTRITPGETITIGFPLDRTATYIVDRWGEPAPAGAVGELLIGGAGLARGYLGRPDLTAERFVPNPFGSSGSRAYRSGDLARYRPDGRIECFGRIDHQVKVRGFRIELQEVEAVLGSHPDVAAAAVAVRENGSEDRRLAAWIVRRTAGEPWIGELRGWLRERLPEHMVPTDWMALAELPLTPSGKVDRKALLRLAPAYAAEPAVAPRTATETALAAVWAEVLGHDVGVTESFFDAGGHSLLGVRLLARIEARFGRRPPLSSLFKAATIERMAGLLEEPASPGGGALVTLGSGGAGVPLFLVHPVGGGVACYAPLARLLAGERPVYGFQQHEGPAEIAGLAAAYAAELQAVHPQGPCLLGGWSLGGLIAFEMARELQSRGREVALLALIDPAAPGDGEGDQDRLWAVALFAYELGLRPEHLGTSVEDFLALDPESQLALVLERAAGLGLAHGEAGRLWLRERFGLFAANLAARQRYAPAPYTGRITLLTVAQPAAQPAASVAWAPLAAGGLDVVAVPGDHFTLLAAPHVDELAAGLRQALGSPR